MMCADLDTVIAVAKKALGKGGGPGPFAVGRQLGYFRVLPVATTAVCTDDTKLHQQGFSLNLSGCVLSKEGTGIFLWKKSRRLSKTHQVHLLCLC